MDKRERRNFYLMLGFIIALGFLYDLEDTTTSQTRDIFTMLIITWATIATIYYKKRRNTVVYLSDNHIVLIEDKNQLTDELMRVREELEKTKESLAYLKKWRKGIIEINRDK